MGGRHFALVIMVEAKDIMSSEDFGAARLGLAPCFCHQAQCPVFPDFDVERVSVHCAGVTCIDFSRMGSQRRFLGDSVEPFLCWIRERLCAARSSPEKREKMCIVENVDAFDESALEFFLGEHFHIASLHISPTIVGLPIERRRKYIVMLSKACLAWHPFVDAVGHQAAFDMLFAMSCPDSLCGSDFMRADTDEVARVIKQHAETRNLPPTRRSGLAWSWYQVLTPALQRAVLSHETSLVRDGSDVRSPVFSNLLQNATYMGPTRSGNIPAMLKDTSYLWSFKHRRGVTGQELFEFHGHTMFEDTAFTCDFKDEVIASSEKTSRQLIGNSMHLAAIGAALLFALSCSKHA
eukprot:6017400-Amphidinium_carterae.2